MMTAYMSEALWPKPKVDQKKNRRIKHDHVNSRDLLE
jgi:hypothetical protein